LIVVITIGKQTLQLRDLKKVCCYLQDFLLMRAGALAGVEMSLKKSKIPFKSGGLMAVIDYLSK